MPETMVAVVDDESAVLASISALLSSFDFKVEIFVSAEAFLESYKPDRYGCLLLDIRLPGMSGIELEERLRTDGCDLPVILMSGHADFEVVQGSMTPFLEKPIGVHDLIEHIQRAID